MYVTYIESTPERVWQALTDADLTAAVLGAQQRLRLAAGLHLGAPPRRRLGHRRRRRHGHRVRPRRSAWPSPSTRRGEPGRPDDRHLRHRAATTRSSGSPSPTRTWPARTPWTRSRPAGRRSSPTSSPCWRPATSCRRRPGRCTPTSVPPKWPATTHPDFFNRLPAPRAPGSRRSRAPGAGLPSPQAATRVSVCLRRGHFGLRDGGSPWAWPFPRSPSSGPSAEQTSRAASSGGRACRLTRPARPADPAAGTTATGWARPATPVRGARPAQGRTPRASHQALRVTRPRLSNSVQRLAPSVSLYGQPQRRQRAPPRASPGGLRPAGRTGRAPPGPGVTAASWASPLAGSVPADGAVDPAGTGRWRHRPGYSPPVRRRQGAGTGAPTQPGRHPASWTALLAGRSRPMAPSGVPGAPDGAMVGLPEASRERGQAGGKANPDARAV